MMSFELFRLLKLKKIYILYIYLYFFSPEVYYGGQVTSFHERNSNILHQIMV